ncbi:MAG: hypothetical protein ACRDH2_13730 [Anaerolineales bacterium]
MSNSSSRVKFNDPPYSQRPVLSFYGQGLWGELIWMALPALVAALALLLR